LLPPFPSVQDASAPETPQTFATPHNPRQGFLGKKIVYFSASASRHAWLASLRWKSTRIILTAKLTQDPAKYGPNPAKK
jgi:hypothetical protein